MSETLQEKRDKRKIEHQISLQVSLTDESKDMNSYMRSKWKKLWESKEGDVYQTPTGKVRIKVNEQGGVAGFHRLDEEK